VILWRISNHSTLDGGGGLRAPGRWHTMGQRILYCAPNPATALLEVLVHTRIDIEDVPVNLRYLEIEVPDTLAIEDVDTGRLGLSWRTDLAATRRVGDQWLRSGGAALLRVPSVIVPATWNVLINPRRPCMPKQARIDAVAMAADDAEDDGARTQLLEPQRQRRVEFGSPPRRRQSRDQGENSRHDRNRQDYRGIQEPPVVEQQLRRQNARQDGAQAAARQ
jgi:RES domain-containing protein